MANTTTYYFEYGRTAILRTQGPDAAGADAGSPTGPTEIQTELTDLVPGATYHYRVVGLNGFGTSRAQDETFTTFQPPSIEGFSSSGLTATSADIRRRINPQGFDTHYYVEYGTSSAYGLTAPIPQATLPAGSSTESVTVHLENLIRATYHFRVVAVSKWGTTATGDQTFNFFPPVCPNSALRQATGSDFIPDCRAYELVSPSDTGNVVLTAVNPAPPSPYATSPARFAFTGFWGAIPGFDTINNSFDVYVSTRTATGWVSRYVGIRGYEALSATIPTGSTDLSKFIDFAGGFGGPSASIPYAWDIQDNFLGRWPMDPAAVPGGEGQSQSGAYQASPDYSHMAFSSNNIDFDPEGNGLTAAPGSAYDYDTGSGSITVISKTAGGDDISQEPGNTESTGEYIKFPPSPEKRPARIYQGISRDGSHILMSTTASPGSSSGRLYMRVADAMTYEVSQGHDVTYVGMTRDGTRVMFASDEPLTADDTDSSADVFMWSEETDSLVRISTGVAGAGDSDACAAAWTENCNAVVVKGEVDTDNSIAGNSGDIYFYSPELLAGPEYGVENAQNLYVYRNGQVGFVASLPSDGSGALERIQVSPTGAHAAFVTRAGLTSYENAGHSEMYSSDPSTGSLICVSCNPSGAPAAADIDASMNGLFMSDDGRTFWATREALVAQDSNAIRDVYEFTESRPQLITAGTGDIDGRGPEARLRSGFSGVSADGVNAYFSTYDTLVAQDHNGPFLKFYDARVGGGFPAPPTLTPCVAADECHGAASAVPSPSPILSDGSLGTGGNVVRPRRSKHNSRHPNNRARRHARAHGRGNSKQRRSRKNG